MKTSQFFTTAILLGLTAPAFSEGDDNKTILDNTSKLTLTIVEIQSPSCNGGSDGSIKVLAEGGKAPYTYNWNTFPTQSTAYARDLKSGTYFVQVKDADNEVYFTSVQVTEPTASILNEFDSGTTGPIDITATVTGNNSPYIFELNGAPTNAQQVYNLPVGIHRLVITDANRCEMIQYIQVFEYESENHDGKENSKGFRINTSKEKLESKDERGVQTSGLIPTQTTGKNRNGKIIVTQVQ